MFNEKDTEFSKKQGKDIPVWQSPKYIEAKQKAIELINSNKYDLTEGDFWILMNETKTGKMGYTGLIISHNGCLKINDKIENKVNPRMFCYDTVNTYGNSLIYTYCDNDVYEVGEVSPSNCKNDYPYAMAFKRCFDRVVLKKCKLAYAGVYSDSEAEEFRKADEEEDTSSKITIVQVNALRRMIKENNISDEAVLQVLSNHNIKKLSEIELEDLQKIRGELLGQD